MKCHKCEKDIKSCNYIILEGTAPELCDDCYDKVVKFINEKPKK